MTGASETPGRARVVGAGGSPGSPGEPHTAEPIPLARPVIGEREQQLVAEALGSGRLSLGPMLERFEEGFRQWLGAGEAIAVSSGTAALHLGVRAHGWGEGDAVLTSPLSFVASVNCLLYERVRPVFCDIDPVTLNLDPALAVEAIEGGGVDGVLPVHIFGYPYDGGIREAAEARGIALLEDACEALGATDGDGAKVGSGSAPATFAFYANKQLATGEGGMITTRDPAFAARVRSERNQGRGPDMGWLDHEGIGFNYRLSELACALGVAQLERLDRMLADRSRVAALYAKRLGTVPGVIAPQESVAEAERRSWFVYVIRLEDSLLGDGAPAERAARRDRVIAGLGEAGIPAKSYMPCLHLLPHLRALGFEAGQFPVAEKVASSTLALPFFPEMSEAQVDRVCEALSAALGA